MRRLACVNLLLVLIMGSAAKIWSQVEYYYDYEFVSKIVITDKKVIDKLVLDLFLAETNVEKIEIFDIDGNGPGEGDLLRVDPSRNVHTLSMLTKETKDILNGIEKDPNAGDEGLTINIGEHPSTPEEEILSIIGNVIMKIYAHDQPLKLYFEQDEDGTYRYNLYGYKKEMLKDSTHFHFGEVSEQQVQDLLKALYQEFASEYKGFQPTVVRIREVIRDTVYVPLYKKKK
ncbi:MAG: hypothetical protein GXO74_01185 [Calditrichaeota bacterium]|nr:hypothetical protein [Calditrichota bacterium]